MENYGVNRVSLPNSTAVLILGIASIVTCCCYGIPGIICGIIAIVLANSAVKMYAVNPDAYTESSYKNLKAGKVCAIIGLIISVLCTFLYIAMIVSIGWDAMNNPELMQERLQELLNQ
ncbi:MAG: hypothetical protein LBH32_00285 [Dysgonamonadaceae bacterium]|jgi:uncharacterized protein YacL|nr:hypothetical protein [Dysgonamonadaceae bacterium]